MAEFIRVLIVFCSRRICRCRYRFQFIYDYCRDHAVVVVKELYRVGSGRSFYRHNNCGYLFLSSNSVICEASFDCHDNFRAFAKGCDIILMDPNRKLVGRIFAVRRMRFDDNGMPEVCLIGIVHRTGAVYVAAVVRSLVDMIDRYAVDRNHHTLRKVTCVHQIVVVTSKRKTFKGNVYDVKLACRAADVCVCDRYVFRREVARNRLHCACVILIEICRRGSGIVRRAVIKRPAFLNTHRNDFINRHYVCGNVYAEEAEIACGLHHQRKLLTACNTCVDFRYRLTVNVRVICNACPIFCGYPIVVGIPL